jgi:putative transposase
MIVCVERRFGTSKAPHLVEWLSGNGSTYVAKDTLDAATALSLQLCFTPVRSPQSNGIGEAFVKTFRRDYARLSILPDAATVIALLPASSGRDRGGSLRCASPSARRGCGCSSCPSTWLDGH